MIYTKQIVLFFTDVIQLFSKSYIKNKKIEDKFVVFQTYIKLINDILPYPKG